MKYLITFLLLVSVCFGQTIMVIQPQLKGCAMTASISVTSAVPCNTADAGGTTTGIITANESSGTSPFTYLWSNSAATQNITVNAATYTVTITDHSSCTATASTTLTQPTALTCTTSNTNPSSKCPGGGGGATGTIGVTASGGTGSKTYSDNGGTTYQAGSSFTGLSVGTYTIQVKDGNSCISPSVIDSFRTVAFTFTTVSPTPSCSTTNGKISITPVGGSGFYNYSDNGGSSFGSSGSFTSLTGQNYTCQVKDGNACLSATQVVCVGHSLGCCFIWEPKDELLWVNLDFNDKYYIK